MRIICWILKSKNTHSEYVTLTVFPLQQWLHERVTMLRCTYFACLVISFVNNNFYRALDLSSGPRQIREFLCGQNVELLVVKFSLLYEDPDKVLFRFFSPFTVHQSIFLHRVKRLSSCCSIRLSRDYGALFFCLFSLVTYGTVSPSIV